MSRDKQLQVRLEHDVREKFKELCQQHDLEMSAFLYSLIRHFVDGTIPIQNFIKPTDSGIDSGAIAEIKKSILADLSEIVQGEVSQAIAGLEGKIAELEGKNLPWNDSTVEELVVAPVVEMVEETKHVAVLPEAEENLLQNHSAETPTAANDSIHGLSSAELAEKLSISPATIKSWAQRWKKSPPEFKPMGSDKAIAIPPYIYQNKKWYPGPEN